ncbi:hypothetical protein [Pelagicoccus mobilis]|uniref:Uncharacterized protein n=1 Tax=Pelagicoccus mobilis TaxID=415221 RepID=A0A934S482_9BACT|nr:hypothetical protein [Pelagicoccus mobilis]MBK1879084.1 hypothetical protein [Pelagicoccus mobilis]
MRSKRLLFVTLPVIWTNTALAQPVPGDVFKDHHWLPEMVHHEAGRFLRIGGRLDYKINEGHFPADRHIDGYIPLHTYVSLKDAIRAELLVEKIGSHEDTKNLRVSFNGHPFHLVPEAEGIPAPEADYMHHTNPIVAIPLDQLTEGTSNTFKFEVDPEQRWDWPQNLVYATTLRIYYNRDDDKSLRPRISSLKDGDTLADTTPLAIDQAGGNIRHIDYIAYSDDVNWEGDGLYQRWHYFYFRGRIIHHIGRSADYPYEVIWDTSWMPDQDSGIKVVALITDNQGVTTMTEAIEDLRLDRNYSVELCKPYNQPKNWVTREDEFSANFDLNTSPDTITAARLLWTSWSPCYANGIYLNGQLVSEETGPCYEYMAHNVSLYDFDIFKVGQNTITTGKEPLHDGNMVHGMEVQWPGVMVLVRSEK